MASRLPHSLNCRRYLLSARLMSDWLISISRGCQSNMLPRPLSASVATYNTCVAKCPQQLGPDQYSAEDCFMTGIKLPVDYTAHSPLGTSIDDMPSVSMTRSVSVIGQQDLLSSSTRLVTIQPTNIDMLYRDDAIYNVLQELSRSGFLYMEKSMKEATCNSSNGEVPQGPSNIPNRNQRPNMDKLNNMKEFLVQEIPDVLVKRHEYRIYTKDIILENNWTTGKPYTVVGLTQYAVQLLKVRAYMHSKYARVQVIILSAAVDEVGGSVAIRWRVEGLPQMKAFMFWKYLPFKVKSKAKEESEWIDGLSTFYLNKEGYIYKHRVDRMMPDKDAEKVVSKPVTPLGVH